MEHKHETVKLSYTIHKYSSYSANYIPENIMANKPTDQLSRWFTDSTTPSQYIMLRLHKPAVVETVKFGKYIKPHVSDLKKFEILGGTDENSLSLLLSAGLKKDSAAESFRLRHRTMEGLYLPVQYIKIVPLQSWGPAYNYTIWFVELHGVNHEGLIRNALDTISLRKEEEAVRVLLKHLRRRRYTAAFDALSRESGVRLEGPLQSRLFDALVEKGDYKQSERIIEEAMYEGEFDWYMSWQPYTPQWRQLSQCSMQVEAELCGYENGSTPAPAPPVPPRPQDLSCADADHGPEDGVPSPSSAGGESCDEQCGSCCAAPGPRGGHQLVIDSSTGTLYLFGGWNGVTDLDDLWSFCTATGQWTLLCRHSGKAGGPSPRSCHKMVFDPVNRRLYTLGRYLDTPQRVPSNLNSDLYMYCVREAAWQLVCADTAACGGPRLVFDHQMCSDPDTQTVYVFGGRVLPPNSEDKSGPVYSGLYAYYIATNSWQQLLPDQHDLAAPQPRVSHSMLFHPVQRRLYMFAGQRNKEHLMDLWWWDVESGACGALCAGASLAPPAAGFTQRATLDPDTDEMFVLSGMSKEKDKQVHNTLWVFSLRRLTWTCVYRNERATPAEPRPRYAHQLVYDHVKKVHYLFGGNPGIQAIGRLRLDDLWSLHLVRPTLTSVLARACAVLRETCYRELCASGRELEAVSYLRNEVRESFDHSDPEQVAHFHRLATALFSGRQPAGACARAPCGLTARRARALARRRAAAAAAPSQDDIARHLAAVLGSDEPPLEPVSPFEEVSPEPPDTWEVGVDDDDDADEDDATRASRLAVYDRLCAYFRPSAVPPLADVADLVKL